MSKPKKLTYGLIAALAIVWGLIFYQFFAAIKGEESVVTTTKSSKTPYFKMINHEHDSVKLDFDYPDPFSNAEAEPIEQLDKEVKIIMPISKTKTGLSSPVNWNAISFNGFVSNAKGKQKVAILIVNGTSLMLGEGQQSNGVKLVKVAGDSVKVNYQNETKFIKLK